MKFLIACLTVPLFLAEGHLPSHEFGLLGHASEWWVQASQVIKKVAGITLGQQMLIFSLVTNSTFIEWDRTCFC